MKRLIAGLSTIRLPKLRGAGSAAIDPQAVDFLPAALAVQQRPPSPTGRWLMWVLMALFSMAVCWALVGQVDIVAVSQGKIIPSGKTKAIQALETRAVVELPVRDGDSVSKGQVLLRLDDSEARSQWQQLSSQALASEAISWRLQSLLNALQGADVLDPDLPLPNLPRHLLHNEQAVLNSQLAALRSELQTLEMQRQERQAELESTHMQAQKWELQLPLATERAASRQALLAKKLVAADSWRELEQQRIHIAQSLLETQARATQLQAALSKSQAQRQQLLAQRQEAAQSEWQANEQKRQQLAQQLVAAKNRLDAHTLRAPVDGVVQQRAVHALGAVVTPAQPVMHLVPAQQRLEVEAQLLNRDKGFVKAGQEVVVKLEAFPFTRYGAIDGKIISISPDAVQDAQGQWLYTAKVELSQSHVMINGEVVPLSPGMNATVEVKTGKRRLIEFVLSPLMRARDESVRER